MAECQLQWVGESGKAEEVESLMCACALHAQLCVRGAREALIGASKALPWFLFFVLGLRRVGQWKSVGPSSCTYNITAPRYDLQI